MKQKHLVLGTGIALASGLVATGLAIHQAYLERQKAQIVKDIRTIFETFGPIKVVYVNDFESNTKVMTGGLVLEDNRVFNFRYDEGELSYQEESRQK